MLSSAVPAANKQLQPTVMPNRWRGASAPFHYALAPRWTAQRAAAELRRYAARERIGRVQRWLKWCVHTAGRGGVSVNLRALLLMAVIAGSLAANAQERSELPSTAGESRHFEFVGFTSGDSRASGIPFDEIYEVVVGRLGVSLDEKVMVAFDTPNTGPCLSRGWTMVPPDDSPPLIVIFADESTNAKQIIGALAHELGHVLQHDAIEGGRSIQSIFNEGFATWAAGPYWLDWQNATSFQSTVASYITAGTYLPLHENDGFLDTLSEDAVAKFGQDCLKRRDAIYTEWAAFIEYLVEEHGRPKLYSLFQTAPLVSDDEASPFLRPNFRAVYGRSLEQLEAAWLEKVTANE